MVRRIAECVTQLSDCAVQAGFEVDEGLFAPEMMPQFLSTHHLARVRQQQAQQLEGLLRQRHAAAFFVQLAGRKVQFEGPEMDEASGLDIHELSLGNSQSA